MAEAEVSGADIAENFALILGGEKASNNIDKLSESDSKDEKSMGGAKQEQSKPALRDGRMDKYLMSMPVQVAPASSMMMNTARLGPVKVGKYVDLWKDAPYPA